MTSQTNPKKNKLKLKLLLLEKKYSYIESCYYENTTIKKKTRDKILPQYRMGG